MTKINSWDELPHDLHVGPTKALGYFGWGCPGESSPENLDRAIEAYRFLFKQPDLAVWLDNAYPDPSMVFVTACHLSTLERLIEEEPILLGDWDALPLLGDAIAVAQRIRTEIARNPQARGAIARAFGREHD